MLNVLCQGFVTGSADGSSLVIDTNNSNLWSSSTQLSNSYAFKFTLLVKQKNVCCRDPVNVVCPIDNNTFISGRDSGIVQVRIIVTSF
jgi:hypothetical protein